MTLETRKAVYPVFAPSPFHTAKQLKKETGSPYHNVVLMFTFLCHITTYHLDPQGFKTNSSNAKVTRPNISSWKYVLFILKWKLMYVVRIHHTSWNKHKYKYRHPFRHFLCTQFHCLPKPEPSLGFQQHPQHLALTPVLLLFRSLATSTASKTNLCLETVTSFSSSHFWKQVHLCLVPWCFCCHQIHPGSGPPAPGSSTCDFPLIAVASYGNRSDCSSNRLTWTT